jgi:hypothetical protein
MNRRVTSVKDIRAGYLYKHISGNDASVYLVCVGKLLGRNTQYFEFIKFEEFLPVSATLESHPLNTLETRQLSINMYSETGLRAIIGHPFDNLVCLGKIIDAKEEKTIKAWITQLKLSGYNISGTQDKEVYLGDWKKRKKLPCVRKFVVGKKYVQEELAFLRTRVPYTHTRQLQPHESYDIIWEFAGMDGDKYLWTSIWYENSAFNPKNKWQRNSTPYAIMENFKDMVEFKPDAEGYQIV